MTRNDAPTSRLKSTSTNTCQSLGSRLWVLVIVCILQLSLSAHAQNFSHLDIENVYFIEDPDNQLSLEQLSDWQTLDTQTFNRGYSDSTWWLKFTIASPYPQNDWLLEFAYPVLDELDIYLLSDEGELLQQFRMGDKLSFIQRPIYHRNFIVPLSLTQNSSIEVFARIRSSSAIQTPIKVWAPNAFYSRDSIINLIEGAFFGGLLVIAIYNFFMYFVIRSHVYLFYLGYNLSLFFFFFSLHGWAFQFLWPNAVNWNDKAIAVSLALTCFFAWNFIGAFLGVKMISPLFARVQNIAVGIASVLIVSAFFLPYSLAISIIILFACFSCLWGYICGITAWKKGLAYAIIFLQAWSVFLLGSIILAASKFGALPINLFTEYAIQLGALLEVLLFSLALADRINKERAMRIRAQQHALNIQRKANEELEFRVEQRTSELEDANLRLKTLSGTDQLTGLKNRRYLDEFMLQAFIKAAKGNYHIAILLIDADHFKTINDTHGHIIGDECLQALALRINDSLQRPSDLVARYGGEEFCVVISDINEPGIHKIAESIRSNVEQTKIVTSGPEIDLTVSIGAVQGIPENEDAMLAFLSLADKALYEAKSNGRNCVRYQNYTTEMV